MKYADCLMCTRGVLTSLVPTTLRKPVCLRSDAGTTSKIGPKVTKGIVEDVCGKVDAVGHLEVFEKTGDRFIRFTGNSKMIAKCQFKGLHEENGIILEEANLPNIISKVKAYSYARKGD